MLNFADFCLFPNVSSPSSNSGCKVRFEAFEFDLRTGELRKHGLPLRLQDQPVRILRLLLSRPGELITRNEIRRELWPDDVFVDYEHGLHRAINKLREALSDSAAEPRFIETRARIGYRFIAPISPGTYSPGQVPLVGDGTESTQQASPNLTMPPERSSAVLAVRAVPLSGRRILGSVFLSAKGIGLLSAVCAVVIIGTAIHRGVQQQQTTPVNETRLRQLTDNSSENPVHSGAISPNGKYLAYSDLSGIHVMLLDTGETQTIPQPAGIHSSRLQWDIAAWFPDSTRFVANLRVAEAQLPSIWTVPLLGGAPKKLRDDAEAWSISPDGLYIAYSAKYRPCGPREVWLMDPEGEREKKLIDIGEKDAVSHLQFSADGQRLLYRRYVEKIDKDILESRDLRSGSLTTVLPPNDRLLDHLWLPDGRLIYSQWESDRHSCNYWMVDVDPSTGQSMGKPHRLSNWSGFCVGKTSVTADGKRLVFLESSGQTDAYIAQLAANSVDVTGITHIAVTGENNPTAWTADGQAVISQRNRNGHWGLFKQVLNAPTMEPIVVDDQVDAGGARVSPDGNWIVYIATPIPKGDSRTPPSPSLKRVSVNGGSSYPIVPYPDSGFGCASSPGTFCAVAGRSPDGKQLIYTELDPVRGQGGELARIEVDPAGDYDWALSPDGRMIILRKNRDARLTLLSLADGTTRDITVDGWKVFDSLDWAPDSKGLFSSALTQTGAVLLHLDLRGRAHLVWQQKGSEFTVGQPSPDGRHLMLAAWTQQGNLWSMEDF